MAHCFYQLNFQHLAVIKHYCTFFMKISMFKPQPPKKENSKNMPHVSSGKVSKFIVYCIQKPKFPGRLEGLRWELYHSQHGGRFLRANEAKSLSGLQYLCSGHDSAYKPSPAYFPRAKARLAQINNCLCQSNQTPLSDWRIRIQMSLLLF